MQADHALFQDQLRAHIQRYVVLSDAECSEIVGHFVSQRLRKKEWAQHADESCNRLYFIAKGCMRGYFVDDAGVEKTLQLALEGWWITDFQAFSQQRVTDNYYQAVEPCNVLSITHADYQRLLSAHPVMERYFRQMYEIAYGAMVYRVKYQFSYSKEEIFFRFRERYPGFVNRVPQYVLATFLGLTPEYLSKLRAKQFS